MKIRFLPLLAILFVSVTVMPFPSKAEPRGPAWGCPDTYEGMPYGRFCPGRGWGPYGARKVVKTAEEAKQAIERYFAGSGRTIQVTNMEERRWFFVADITDPDGKLVDRLIVDKRTGRIRSVY